MLRAIHLSSICEVEYQSANGSFGFLGSPATKTMNTLLKFAPPAGSLWLSHVHDFGDAGYGLLRYINGNTIEKNDIPSNFQFVAWTIPAKIRKVV